MAIVGKVGEPSAPSPIKTLLGASNKDGAARPSIVDDGLFITTLGADNSTCDDEVPIRETLLLLTTNVGAFIVAEVLARTLTTGASTSNKDVAALCMLGPCIITPLAVAPTRVAPFIFNAV